MYICIHIVALTPQESLMQQKKRQGYEYRGVKSVGRKTF